MKSQLFASLLLIAIAGYASAQTPAPTSSPISSPISSPSPSPGPAAGRPAQTIDGLRSLIFARLARPELRRGQVGIKIVSLNSGKVVFEQNSEKYFMPASNMKNFTVAAALEKLTPDFRFVTSVYASALPDSNGVVGSLRIFGRGDVSISTAFFSPDETDKDPVTGRVDPNKVYYKGIDRLVDRIIAAGIKRIEGNLIADETYFTGNPVPGTWEWDDLQWYYGAEISALPLNDNAVDLSVKPTAAGQPCAVKVSPSNAIVTVNNLCTTTAAGTPRTLGIEKKVDRNILHITGTLPVGNAGFNRPVTVSRPAELFVALLKERLVQRGVVVTGQTRAVNDRTVVPTDLSVEVARLESVALREIAAKTMKPSQNMYTETLLWTLGEHSRIAANGAPGGGMAALSTRDSSELGIAAVRRFLTEIGVAPDGIIQHDGSGLSRHNLITPAAVVQLYTYMGKQSKFSHAWRESLTIGGVDGTLRNRFGGTRASGNVRGKTGTIDQVSALSGYVRTAAGEELVFSMIVNGVNEGPVRTSAMDEIVVALANFDGKID